MSSTPALVCQSTDPISTAEIIEPKTLAATQVSDSPVDALNIVIAIAKEVGQSFEHFPVVKSVAGIVLQILKVRDVSKADLDCGPC